jgi:hypothetical protein
MTKTTGGTFAAVGVGVIRLPEASGTLRGAFDTNSFHARLAVAYEGKPAAILSSVLPRRDCAAFAASFRVSCMSTRSLTLSGACRIGEHYRTAGDFLRERPHVGSLGFTGPLSARSFLALSREAAP